MCATSPSPSTKLPTSQTCCSRRPLRPSACLPSWRKRKSRVGGFRQVQHGLHQAGFPCAAMACYKDVADVIVRVVHILFPLFVHARKACGNLYKNIIIFSSYIKDVTKKFSPKRLPKLCSFPCIYCQKAPLGTPEALWKLFQISNQRISLAAISSSKLAPSPVYTVVCCGS